tara:strand:- start:274 stop:396 length:123 start_codon:yes stop_codon:yes gene_type:complete
MLLYFQEPKKQAQHIILKATRKPIGAIKALKTINLVLTEF